MISQDAACIIIYCSLGAVLVLLPFVGKRMASIAAFGFTALHPPQDFSRFRDWSSCGLLMALGMMEAVGSRWFMQEG